MIVGTWIGWLITLFVVVFVGLGVLGLLYWFRPWSSPSSSSLEKDSRNKRLQTT